jgi:hypothetical protein
VEERGARGREERASWGARGERERVFGGGGLTSGPHQEGRRRLGNRPVHTRAVGAGRAEPLGVAGPHASRPAQDGGGVSFFYFSSYFSHNSLLECMIHKPSQSNNKNA